MFFLKQRELQTLREYSVVKSNDLIQRSRYQLSTVEQKIVLYLISKIKPDDEDFKLYDFQIKQFCEVCGIDETSGKNYSDLKITIKNLADKSVWVTLADGRETLVRWVERPYIDKKSGIIQIKLDDLMKPYLLELQEHFTRYNLYFILAMKSKYSLRLYEILKSYENMGKCEFDIENLKKKLFAEQYKTTQHFNDKVIGIAVREINDYGDIDVKYELIRQGRAFKKIKFSIRFKKNIDERVQTFKRIEEKLKGE